MYRLTVIRHFDAAHYLENYDGKCANLHGHTWQVEVVLSGDALQNGMLVDFTVVKRRLDALLPDHTSLNDRYDFNPTAENLAEYFYSNFHIPTSLILEAVTVWESDACSATYAPEKKRNAISFDDRYRDSVGCQTVGAVD